MYPKGKQALALARMGYKVFPLSVDDPNKTPAEIKKPAIKDWPKLATSDPAQIVKWWEEADFNPAIATLPSNRLVVIDYDCKEGQKGAIALANHRTFDIPEAFAVETPTGGWHLYFRSPEGADIGNSTNQIAENVDVRAQSGGYVLAPGATIHGKPYRKINIVPYDELPELPDWLVRKAKTARTKTNTKKGEILGDLDTPENIRRAQTWLDEEAPDAIQGHGGNNTTYQVACRVRDFGVSKEQCLELLISDWNEIKAAPPWSFEELETLVGNAYQYATLPVGVANATAEFEAAGALIKDGPQPWPHATAFDKFDVRELPQRQWIVPGFLVRHFVTGLISPGGMGKTQLVVSTCLAVASGSEKPLARKVLERVPVWYWNQEDDADELKRRFAAAMQHNGLTWDDISIDGKRAVHVDSGVDRPLMLAIRRSDGSIGPNKKVVQAIINEIKCKGIGVFIFDPLVEFHEAEENNNVEMRTVMAIARQIAVEGNCAVLAVAHTRKPSQANADGFAGDIDSLRGAGAQTNVMRLGLTLFSMSEKDAKRWGVPERDRHQYVRLDVGKSNLSLSDGKPQWFRRVGVHLGDMETGENVGVLEPANLKEKAGDADMWHSLARALAAHERRGEFVAIADVLSLMGEQEATPLTGKNRTRTIARMFEETPGVFKTGDDTWEGDTEFGRLTIVKAAARSTGWAVKLTRQNTTKNSHNSHEECGVEE